MDSQVRREARARWLASRLRQAVAELPEGPPTAAKWQHFRLAEEAMFEKEALTKKAIKSDVPQSLVALVERLESWAPTLGFEMPKRKSSGGLPSGVDAPEGQYESGKANLPTVFGFDARQRELLVDYLVTRGVNSPKAKLTVAMVANALRKVAEERGLEASADFPLELAGLREQFESNSISRDYLQGSEMPTIFSQLIADYQTGNLKPEEQNLPLFVIVAFLANEM